MEVIFIGGLFPEKLKADIEKKSKGTIDYAADTLQKALIKGLDFFTTQLKIINLPFLSIYPFYSDFRLKSFHFSHNDLANDINVGFLNLPIIKKVSRYLKTKAELFRSIKKGNEIILIYSLHTPFIKAAVDLKSKYPSIKVCVIVPDLMQFTSEESRWRPLRYINSKEQFLLERLLEKVDSFVVLSDFMYKPLRIGKRPWTRVEGIFIDAAVDRLENKESLKTVLYSGTLAKRYGILELLDAFAELKDEGYRLWICGNGDCREELIRRANTDRRIIYWGQLPREKVLQLQKRAMVLVNPRTSKGEFTKYSFPSKIMEYLGSGTPTILHRLPGVPDEYYQYVFVPDNETSEALKRSIMEVCKKSNMELQRFGDLAKKFVKDYKTPYVQCEKVYKMISDSI